MKGLMYQAWIGSDGLWHWVAFTFSGAAFYSLIDFDQRELAELDAKRFCKRLT